MKRISQHIYYIYDKYLLHPTLMLCGLRSLFNGYCYFWSVNLMQLCKLKLSSLSKCYIFECINNFVVCFSGDCQNDVDVFDESPIVFENRIRLFLFSVFEERAKICPVYDYAIWCILGGIRHVMTGYWYLWSVRRFRYASQERIHRLYALYDENISCLAAVVTGGLLNYVEATDVSLITSENRIRPYIFIQSAESG